LRLDDSEIDLSCKFDLFDVLDADLSGELEFEASGSSEFSKAEVYMDYIILYYRLYYILVII